MAPRYLGGCLQSLTFMLIRVTEITRKHLEAKNMPPSGWRVARRPSGGRVKGNNPPSSFFFENIVNNFHNTVFILFSETLIISQTKSWVSQNNRKVKKRVWVNRTQRHGASQSHSSCCELIGHRRPTDEVVLATATTQRPPSSAGSECLRCKFKFIRGVSEFSQVE